MFSHHRLLVATLLFILSVHSALADTLDDFSSDGCSRFPNGTLTEENLWCDCCITHDIAYWQGGSTELKKQADEALRVCVLNKTGSILLADTMYYGVRVGGLPILPTAYRWGYGWEYGRGFQPLNTLEKEWVKKKLAHYFSTGQSNNCGFNPQPR